MNRDFIDWLTREKMPMFDIRRLAGCELWVVGESRFMAEAYEVIQNKPRQIFVIECNLDELLESVQHYFPLLRSAVAEVAIRKAVEDLRLDPWWLSAGPMTEELRWLLREAFKNLPAVLKEPILRSPVKKVLDHARV